MRPPEFCARSGVADSTLLCVLTSSIGLHALENLALSISAELICIDVVLVIECY